MPIVSRSKYAWLVVALALINSPQLGAREKFPQVSEDGLQLQEHTKLRAVYLKPGASLAKYDRVAILDCYVAFRKNWERDYNNEAMGLNQRITQKDIDRIKQQLADEFRKVFTKELQDKGYQVVDDAAADVLIVRPAIIDLDITAPDTMSPGMEVTLVASAGEMTLYMELYDSLSSELLARVIDPEGKHAISAASAWRPTESPTRRMQIAYYASGLTSSARI